MRQFVQSAKWLYRRCGGRILCLLASLCAVSFLVACGSFWQKEAVLEEDALKKGGLKVIFFGCTEDADSILLHSEEGNVMIDTGVSADAEGMISDMKEMGIAKLDLLILTHPDKDHIGGVPAVLSEFEVDEVLQTSCEKGSELQSQVNALLEKETVRIPFKTEERQYGGLALSVYPPKEDFYDNSNNYSLGVLAEYEGVRFFFAGDAKKKRLGELLEEDLPGVDVYKVSHHGRDNKNSEEMIEKLQPNAAVVTSAYPEEKTAVSLKRMGVRVYTTLYNTVCFSVKNGEIFVEEFSKEAVLDAA